MASLTSKIAIVTGSTKGIGEAIAQRLADEGAMVVTTGRSEGASIALDLREPDAAQRLVDYTIAQHGRIDIVVSNAGATKRGDFLDLTDADFADGFALKYFGAVRLTRAAWPHLKASCGSVVYISGIGGRTPGAQFTIGGSVNAALLSFTKAMAELGVKDGVQVNAINPGTIRTERMKARLKTPEDEAAFIRDSKVSRIGETRDIAALTAFLVGPEGRFLHGSLIDADGGATKTI
jgi:NAD(P)-dependent dehydrogenase (short-subunit alcohol dehydrogenase family)